MAASPSAAPAQAPPRSRRPRERRRHPPPPAGAAARPGVADSDRSQSQDGPLASGPKCLSSSVCEGRTRRRTESLMEAGQRRGQPASLSALVGPTLPRIPNGNGPVRGQLSAWVGTALSRFPSGNGPARGQPAAWVGPTLSRIPSGNRPARGQPAACGLLGRSDAVPGPLWTRASEGTAAGTSLASSGVSSAGADANFLLLAPPSGLSLRDFCTIRPEKHHRVGAIAGDVRSPAQDQGAAISAAAHPSEAPGTAPKRYILTSLCRN